MVVVLPEAVLGRLCRQPVGHECLHDSEESQSDARQLAQGEGDETLGGDLEVVSLVQYIAAACCSLLLDLGSVTGGLRWRVRCKHDEDLEHDPAPPHTSPSPEGHSWTRMAACEEVGVASLMPVVCHTSSSGLNLSTSALRWVPSNPP